MHYIEELLKGLTISDMVAYIIVFLIAFCLIIEKIDKLPFKPLTHFFKWVGSLTTKEIADRLDKLEKDFEQKNRDDDEKEAKRLRARIIAFADSCRVGHHHTQAHFENIMRDYSDYEHYCTKRGFPNHYIDSEFKYIEKIYQERLEKDDFL